MRGDEAGCFLVVEDDARLARLLVHHLDATGESAVVAHMLAEARQRMSKGVFDAFIVDLALPDRSGWSIVESVRQQSSELPLLVLTGAKDLENVNRAQRFGVELAYKTAGWTECLARFIERVCGFRARSDMARVLHFARRHRLTPKERHVLLLYVRDCDREQIAQILGVTKATIRAHVRSILRKSGLGRMSSVRKEIRNKDWQRSLRAEA